VPWSGAPDCPVCHRTVSGAPGPYSLKLATLGFLRARSTIITGLSGVPPDYPVHQRSDDNFVQRSPAKVEDSEEQYATVRDRAELPVRGTPDTEQCMSGAASDCPVPLEDKASNGQKLLNPNSWVTWLAHRTVRCAHRQQPAPTVNWWLRAINTPNHHYSNHPSIPHIAFNTRAIDFTPRHKSKQSIHSKSQIQL
jgi:hypothetical protein